MRPFALFIVLCACATSQSGSKDRPWTIAFERATLRDVVLPYSDILGAPIVIDEQTVSAPKRLTFRSEGKVSKAEARALLEEALRAEGLALMQRDDLFVIVPIEGGESTTMTGSISKTLRDDRLQKARAIATHEVAFDIGKTKLTGTDAINIQSVKGNRSTFEVGGTYIVEGEYTLASQESARLAVFVTNGAVERNDAITLVSKGSGTFALVFVIEAAGFPHVSFYPAAGGKGFGGVYFGKADSLRK